MARYCRRRCGLICLQGPRAPGAARGGVRSLGQPAEQAPVYWEPAAPRGCSRDLEPSRDGITGGRFLVVRRLVQASVVLVGALALGGITFRQFAPAPVAEGETAPPIPPQSRSDAKLGRQDHAEILEPALAAERMEPDSEASKVDALWESLRKFPGVEAVNMDDVLRNSGPVGPVLTPSGSGVNGVVLETDAGAGYRDWQASLIQVEAMGLDGELSQKGTTLKEALARCSPASGEIKAQDERFCEDLRPSEERCEMLRQTPKKLQTFIDWSEASSDEAQGRLSVRAVELSRLVVLFRNVCR